MKVSGTRLLLSYNEICNVILGSPYQIQVSFKDLLRFDVILFAGCLPSKEEVVCAVEWFSIQYEAQNFLQCIVNVVECPGIWNDKLCT